MRVVGILATYNEERFIRACIEHLAQQGCEVYLCDNESSDATVAIAKEFEGRGICGIETIPRHGTYEWGKILARKEELAASLDADWFMHVDADEFHLPPRSDTTLARAFEAVDAEGYNAVSFTEYTFLPTREEPDHDPATFLETLRSYYAFVPRPLHRLNAWKKQPQRVDLRSAAGHKVMFPGQRVYPTAFPMKHYLFLDREHAAEKYARRVFDEAEVESGWHGWRARVSEMTIDLPPASEMERYTTDDALDASRPRTKHWTERWAAAR